MSNLLPNEKWTTCPLSYLCDADGSIQTGPFGTQLHASDYVPSGVPCIMPQDIIDGRISTEKIAYISEENANRLSNFRLLQNDIIYPRRGDIAKHALITSKENGWLCGTGCLRIRLNTSSILPQYLYYYLTLPHVREWIAQNSVGATMPHLNTSLVGQISVSYPTYNEQQVITNILGSLDDKIDLNRRMNETLEAMARALFRDWFVDFGPTQAKMAGEAPYLAPELWELFPDRLDDEGKPEGWELRRLHDILEFNYGKSLPTQKRIKGEIPVYGSGGVTGLHNEALVTTPTIIVGRKGTVGALYWENRTCFPIDTVFYVTSKLPLSYCFYLLETLGLENMNTDAAVPGLNRDNAYRLEVFYPPAVLIHSFANIVENWRNKIITNESESRTLAQLRDLLLPKLMSGEISIRDAEKMVENAA